MVGERRAREGAAVPRGGRSLLEIRGPGKSCLPATYFPSLPFSVLRLKMALGKLWGLNPQVKTPSPLPRSHAHLFSVVSLFLEIPLSIIMFWSSLSLSLSLGTGSLGPFLSRMAFHAVTHAQVAVTHSETFLSLSRHLPSTQHTHLGSAGLNQNSDHSDYFLSTYCSHSLG